MRQAWVLGKAGRLPAASAGGDTNARPRGSWLLPVWVVAAIFSGGLFVAALPSRWSETHAASATLRSALERHGLSVDVYTGYSVGLEVMIAAAFFAVAGLIVARKPHEQMALFVALMLVTFGAGIQPTTAALSSAHPTWHVPVQLLSFLAITSFLTSFYLFPDGRFVPGWTRPLALVFILCEIPYTLFPGTPFERIALPNPLPVVAWLGWLLSCISVQIYRYWRVSSSVQRQQTKWLVYGWTMALVLLLAVDGLRQLMPALDRPGSLYSLSAPTLDACAFLLIPLSTGVAILRHRLFDIDLIINRTLVYAALTLSVVAIYVAVVGYLGVLFRTDGNPAIALVATSLVAVLFQPLRDRVQRAVNHLMYGERDEPHVVLSRLGRRLEESLSPEATLPAIVETVAEALKLPYAAIAINEGGQPSTAAAYRRTSAADVDPTPVRLPLVYQREAVGELLLVPRAPGERFSPADHRLLESIAHQAGAAAHAARLTADLQRSRERLVAAREEERRRLRRDLHDGLGPRLASLSLQLAALRNRLVADPVATAQITDLKAQLQDAVADVRRLVYALRPPALDELGLVPAIGEYAARLNGRAADGGGPGEEPRVTVQAPEPLPPLPAAVEVAAYRITLEALTNAARHARARACVVRITHRPRGSDGPAALSIEISDDGEGLSPAARAGTGLISMRERAEELGGACVIEPAPGGGTRVHACLPLPDDTKENT